jgi:hypothetical protein
MLPSPTRPALSPWEPDGRIAAAGWTFGVEQTLDWIDRHAGPGTVAFVDAPLLVLNDHNQRICEKQGAALRPLEGVRELDAPREPAAAGVRLRSLLEAAGWRYDDGTSGSPTHGRVVSECYPYTTIVGAHELAYDLDRPRYKRKPPRMPVVTWRPLHAAACGELTAECSGSGQLTRRWISPHIRSRAS